MNSVKDNGKIQSDSLQADDGVITLVMLISAILIFGLGVQVGQILAWLT